MRFNASKYKVVHIWVKHPNFPFTLMDPYFVVTNQEKDWGIMVDNSMKTISSVFSYNEKGKLSVRDY